MKGLTLRILLLVHIYDCLRSIGNLPAEKDEFEDIGLIGDLARSYVLNYKSTTVLF